MNHVPKTIGDGASRVFKTFNDKIMGLYNRVIGSTALSAGNQVQLKGSWSTEPEPFNPIELEQAFSWAYRSYRVNGRPKMDVDTFFNRIRKGLIEMIKRELNDLNSARVQMTAWIRFVRDDDEPQERVELAVSSVMTSVYRGSDLDQIVDEMITHMKTQIENPVLLNSRFIFDKVLFLDVNFHQLNLTRGSSHLPLPNFIAKRKAIINPQNEDEECFRWAIITADNSKNIKFNPERISNLKTFLSNYDWSGLEFPVSLKQIGKFEENNNIPVNILS